MAKRLTTRLSAGAALVTGIGMVGIAAAAPAQAEVTNTLEYTCEVSDLGIKFKDPWTVDLTVGVEEKYDKGAEIAAPEITAEVTPGDDAAKQMTSLGIESLEGDATAKYSFGDTEREAELTVPNTKVEDGTITTVATGTGSAETAPDEDVNVPITAGDFTAKLTAQSGFVLNLACTAPEDNAVGNVSIGDAEPPAEEPGDDSGEEPGGDTGEEPGGDTGEQPGGDTGEQPEGDAGEQPSDDAGAGDEAPAPTDDAAAGGPEVPAVVQTDGVQEQGSDSALALGGLLLAGAGAGAIVVARRKAAQH